MGNKVRIVDMFTKKQKFLPPEEWVMFKNETGEIVPAIVEEALWEQANEVLRRRSEDVKNWQGICNHANLLTGKLYCTLNLQLRPTLCAGIFLVEIHTSIVSRLMPRYAQISFVVYHPKSAGEG